MNTMLPVKTVAKLPPSELGFVCKPDLPPHINILFRARPPLPYISLKPREIHRKYTGVFDCGNCQNVLALFEKESPPKVEETEIKYIKKLKDLVVKLDKQKEINKEKIKQWNPKSNPNATSDPYKTLFVYKLDPSIDEKRLKRRFEYYGSVKKVSVIRDLKGQSRHYAFVEFYHLKDFLEAYKDRSVIEIKDKTVETDYERGRTESSFKPRRFGGTLGGRPMPEWLEKQLDKIRERYPELIEEKADANANIEEGEILVQDSTKKNNQKSSPDNSSKNEYLGRKKHRHKSHSKSKSSYRNKSNSKSISKNDKIKKNYKDTEIGEIV